MPEREITFREAVREALREALRADERVFLLGQDIGIYGGAFAVTLGLIEEFGRARVIDTPISEAAMIGAGAGAALVGSRPVVEIQFSDFIGIGMDQLVNQAAKIRFMFGGKATVPMVLRAPIGCGTGAAAQHSQSQEAWYAHVPGLKVVMPATAYDAKGLLHASLLDDNPVLFFEHKLLYPMKSAVPDKPYTVPLGKAKIRRSGRDVTLLAYALQTVKCLQAADLLADQGIDAEVLDLRTLRPLDTEAIAESIKRTHKAVVVYEAPRTGGFGAEIAAFIGEELFDELDAPVMRLGGLDMPVPYNPNLEQALVPQPDTIAGAVKKLLNRR
ncbi:MAG TPA: alpha-ketoacid dehydrogenase subunit beta [Atribacteraceae bacterium]|nr:alpha-ketoacid dehydrogenase subunit beta [Atribacteraceae bacterium]